MESKELRRLDFGKSFVAKKLIVLLRELSGMNHLLDLGRANQRLLAVHEACDGKALMMKYEDFIRKNFAAIDAYLGTNISSDFTVVPKYGRVSRKGGQGEWRDWFTESDWEYFDQKFAPIYATFDYAPEAPSPTPVIDRQFSAEYVVETMNEWRERRGIPVYHARAAKRPDVPRKFPRFLKRLRAVLRRRF